VYQRAGVVAQVVEFLPSKYQALSSNPSTAKKKKNVIERATISGWSGKWGHWPLSRVLGQRAPPCGENISWVTEAVLDLTDSRVSLVGGGSGHQAGHHSLLTQDLSRPKAERE
jgi:hypothetical protein